MKFTSTIAVLAAAIASVSADTRGPTVGQDLCCASNQQRAMKGLPALQWDPVIDTIAQRQSEYQVSIGKISHYGPPGQLYELGGRLQSVGFVYRTAGENVGSGFSNVDSITTAWMNSDGHRANILSSSSTVCGGGVATGGYYTIDYASPMNTDDKKGYYTLQCSGAKSLGAYTGDAPIAHKPQPSVAPKPPVQPVQSPVVPKAPVQPVQPPAKPQPQPQPPAQSPIGHSPSEQPQPPAQPQTPVQPPAPGKCKLMPKGSIAAGKCKPCKKCGSKPSPFRR